MRGDSLRDLYAKTLAVLGLGLLAGAGAVVDYWPTNPLNDAWPATPELVALRPSATGLVPNLDQQIVVPATAPSTKADIAEVAIPEPEPLITTAVSDPVASIVAPGLTIDLFHPEPLPADFLTATAVMEFPAALESFVAMDLSLPPAPPPAGWSDGAKMLLSGAVRKTRESIKEARASVRESLNEAFRGVVGAFKRVSPFKDGRVVTPTL